MSVCEITSYDCGITNCYLHLPKTKSLTPMKLLTTIAAVLISISAFSQDYVEYDNGTFTQNGEELSMEQIDDFTQRYNTGIGNFRRGYKFDEMHKNPYLRSTNNFLNRFGGGVSGFYGAIGVFYGALVAVISVEDSDVNALGLGVLAAAGGAGLCVVSYNAFSRITSSSEGCLRKRDEQFNKVADKINEAIKIANQ